MLTGSIPVPGDLGGRKEANMAIDAKVSFMNQLQNSLSDAVTIDTMTKILAAFSDISERFDMREMDIDEEQDDLMDCFLEAMTVQGRSEQTIENYRRVLKNMMEAVKVKTRRITVYHLRQYIASLKARGLKDSTMEGYRQICSSYFGWLHREGLIEKNPVSNLGSIKVGKHQKETFSTTDMVRMEDACHSLRDRAIVSFLASTGCRVGELVILDRDALKFGQDGAECVVHGKGDKERKVYLSAVAAMLVRRYLKDRKDDNPALFVNRYNNRFETNGIRDFLKRLEEASGVEHIHPHKFRRTLATTMAKRGMPIQEVAKILGHDKLETTMEYVQLSDEDTKQSYKRYAS